MTEEKSVSSAAKTVLEHVSMHEVAVASQDVKHKEQ